jgi:HAD superfamily phosphatase (TIGR01668 family)
MGARHIHDGVSSIDLALARAAGKKALILDVDNTLVSRRDGMIPEDVLEWLDEAKEMGFELFLVSNNWHRDILRHSRELGIPLIRKAMKPFPLANRLALRRMGVSARDTIVIGDQLMTDILGAKLAGIQSALVRPLSQTDLRHTLLLRKLEGFILRHKDRTNRNTDAD